MNGPLKKNIKSLVIFFMFSGRLAAGHASEVTLLPPTARLGVRDPATIGRGLIGGGSTTSAAVVGRRAGSPQA
jgi:hypothetical protein